MLQWLARLATHALCSVHGSATASIILSLALSTVECYCASHLSGSPHALPQRSCSMPCSGKASKTAPVESVEASGRCRSSQSSAQALFLLRTFQMGLQDLRNSRARF